MPMRMTQQMMKRTGEMMILKQFQALMLSFNVL
jgi:hypothetical protein